MKTITKFPFDLIWPRGERSCSFHPMRECTQVLFVRHCSLIPRLLILITQSDNFVNPSLLHASFWLGAHEPMNAMARLVDVATPFSPPQRWQEKLSDVRGRCKTQMMIHKLGKSVEELQDTVKRLLERDRRSKKYLETLRTADPESTTINEELVGATEHLLCLRGLEITFAKQEESDVGHEETKGRNG